MPSYLQKYKAIRLAQRLSLVLLLGYSVVAHAETKQILPQLEQPFIAPDFSLRGEDGKTYTLAQFRGQVVVMNFWATWCPPCREEMPSMERLWQKVRGKGIVLLGVNVGESTDTIFEFTGSYPMSFPIPMDIEGKVIESYPVQGLPTTFIIDPSGKVTHRAIGSREWDSAAMVQMLQQLTKQ